MGGGLYQENHKKLDRQKLEYEEELKEEEEQRRLDEENEKRAAEGLEKLSMEEWQTALKNASPKKEEAHTDLTRFCKLEPTNREAREMLQQAKERLKEIR